MTSALVSTIATPQIHTAGSSLVLPELPDPLTDAKQRFLNQLSPSSRRISGRSLSTAGHNDDGSYIPGTLMSTDQTPSVFSKRSGGAWTAWEDVLEDETESLASIASRASHIVEKKPTTWKEYLWGLLEPGAYYPPSKLYDYSGRAISILSFLIVTTSCTIFCLETIPSYKTLDSPTLYKIEVACIAFFTLEFILRWISSPRPKRFITRAMNFIDLMAIFPFYLELLLKVLDIDIRLKSLVLLRVFRLSRVLRVLKLSRHNDGMRDIGETLLLSSDALSLTIFLMLTVLVLFSSAMFYAEQLVLHWDPVRKLWVDKNEKPSEFQSVPHTFWWCAVTLTTVGYGDVVPTTPLGKCIASLAMCCGVLAIAFPTMILGGNFQVVRELRIQQRLLLHMEKGKVNKREMEFLEERPLIPACGCNPKRRYDIELQTTDEQGNSRGRCREEGCDCTAFMRSWEEGHTYCQYCLHPPSKHRRVPKLPIATTKMLGTGALAATANLPCSPKVPTKDIELPVHSSSATRSRSIDSLMDGWRKKSLINPFDLRVISHLRRHMSSLERADLEDSGEQGDPGPSGDLDVSPGGEGNPSENGSSSSAKSVKADDLNLRAAAKARPENGEDDPGEEGGAQRLPISNARGRSESFPPEFLPDVLEVGGQAS